MTRARGRLHAPTRSGWGFFYFCGMAKRERQTYLLWLMRQKASAKGGKIEHLYAREYAEFLITHVLSPQNPFDARDTLQGLPFARVRTLREAVGVVDEELDAAARQFAWVWLEYNLPKPRRKRELYADGAQGAAGGGG